MLSLVPDWAHHYGEFWRAIRVRNLWFIRLRYLAVVILIAFLLIVNYLFSFRLSEIQFVAILIIAVTILFYNIIIHVFRLRIGCSPNKFNCLHTSLIMMVLDLMELLLLVYFTGTIDSPLIMLFVFHMIIGSMILPGFLVYTAAAIISISLVVLLYLEYLFIIPSHKIIGTIQSSTFLSSEYDLIYVLTFSFTLFVSVYITNKISRQLFKREQQLRDSLEKLKEAENTKQRYTLGVVHEIKSPVIAVKSIIDLLLGNYVGPVNLEITNKLQRARLRSDEAISLINDILRFSRIKLLDIKNNELVRIEELIKNILDVRLEDIEEKNIMLSFSDKRKEKCDLYGAPMLLELALSNLISNAIKYSRQNGEIFIILTDEKELLFIEISDNGIGIPEPEQKDIFLHFYRATNVKKSEIEGSGMGLSITHEIIVKHQGEISIISPSKIGNADSPGTTVIIKLPYKKAGLEIDTVTSEEYS
ncbi:MAG: histidine kinase [Ignavibacteria bacterium]|nr:MAG: histidine kinase [Ignavibacteria bacterium]KAF0162060.1 MAG: histidine kinase [Ignavibacteria bacterium]